MKEIDANSCMNLLREKFPKFVPYWDSFVKENALNNGLFDQLTPFEDYSIEIIRNGNESEIKDLFNFVEILIEFGTSYVRDAITTGYLEYLMNNDPDEIQFSKFSSIWVKNQLPIAELGTNLPE